MQLYVGMSTIESTIEIVLYTRTEATASHCGVCLEVKIMDFRSRICSQESGGSECPFGPDVAYYLWANAASTKHPTLSPQYMEAFPCSMQVPFECQLSRKLELEWHLESIVGRHRYDASFAPCLAARDIALEAKSSRLGKDISHDVA